MKRKCIYLYAILINLLTLSSLCYSQKKISIDLSKSCSFSNRAISNNNLYSFAPSTDAKDIINKIVNELGLKVNFIIQAASVDNACAIVNEGVRYIFYSESFIQEINLKAKTNWSGVLILAHEIGHHLNGHTLDAVTDTALRKQYELEADEFAGNILGRFGASISEAQIAIQTAILNDRQTSLYPSKRARLEAVAVGWKKGSVKSQKETEISVPPGNAGTVTIEKTECAKNNTGNYSFTNSTSKRVKVYLYVAAESEGFGGPMIDSPTGGYMNVKWSAGDITIEPGETESFYNIKAIALVCDIREVSIDRYGLPNGFRKKTNILVETCQTKTFVIK